ncbi:MAG TPA: alpha/beta fold hydrolase [Armatimonadota bacterium]|jgi:dienelactone hydrolase
MESLESFTCTVERVDLDVETEAPKGHGDYEGLPGLVYRPAGRGPWPAVLCFHGRRASKFSTFYECSRLASRGYLTVAFDLPGHGERERIPENDSRLSPAWMAPCVVHEARQVADQVLSRPDVVGGRLAVTGFSLGGSVGLLSLACNPSIQAAICFMGKCDYDFLGASLDPWPKLEAREKGHILLVAGTHDPVIDPSEVEDAFHSLRRRCPNLRVEYRHYPLIHTTTAEVEHAAYDWLEYCYPAKGL